MNSETRKFVVAGIEARLRELNDQSRKIGEEITKFGRLRALYTKNGATSEGAMEKKVASSEKLRAFWREQKAKARMQRQLAKPVTATVAPKAPKPRPTRVGRRLKAAQSDADQVLSLLTPVPQLSMMLKRAVKPRDWKMTMRILKTMPGVIVEGMTLKTTLRLGEKS